MCAVCVLARKLIAGRKSAIYSCGAHLKCHEKGLQFSSIALFVATPPLVLTPASQGAEFLLLSQDPQHRETMAIAAALLLLFGLWIWRQRGVLPGLRQSMPPEARFPAILTDHQFEGLLQDISQSQRGITAKEQAEARFTDLF
jgi:hypothetical protein